MCHRLFFDAFFPTVGKVGSHFQFEDKAANRTGQICKFTQNGSATQRLVEEVGRTHFIAQIQTFVLSPLRSLVRFFPPLLLILDPYQFTFGPQALQ